MNELAEHEDFGGYRPVRKVGQGGTSVVFEGRRLSGDFTRRVAIKVVLSTIPASLPESETRNLARLEHPNIARLLDAGSTRTGLHFLVMEYVDGVPCTEYANRQELDPRGRLRLFLQICEAVQYANRALVIHCDLKPANVLVSSDGTVKLLDFGISRVLSDASGADARTRAQFYTADYASPEQILGRPLTVATDVYSLGALLCELAGGRPPRRLTNSSLAETLRAVQEDSGALPLNGDLEQIARKALRADPAQRYGSVRDLADDVQRYMTGRPVEARPPLRSYRLRKFVARNRLAVGAAVAVAAALLVLAGITVRQRRLAIERLGQIRTLAHSVLFEMHDAIAKLPASLEARHVLVNRSVEYLDALARSAGTDDGIQLEAARGYLRLADIEGVSNEPSLGQSGQALPRLQRADRMVSAVIARSPDNREARRARYDVLEALASIYSLRGDAQAIPSAEALLRVAEENLKAQPQEERVQDERAAALAKVANIYTQSNTLGARGVDAWQTATAAWKKLHEEKPTLVRKRELCAQLSVFGGSVVAIGEARRSPHRQSDRLPHAPGTRPGARRGSGPHAGSRRRAAWRS